MARFAVGKDAYGISDRSGFRYRLRDMRKEWNGLLVGRDEWESKHPQLEPVRHPPDAQALRDPRPDSIEDKNVTIEFPIFDLTQVKFLPAFPVMHGAVGSVSLSLGQNLSVTGVSLTSSIGSVTVSIT